MCEVCVTVLDVWKKAFWTTPLIGGLEKGGYCINCLIRLLWQSLQRMGGARKGLSAFGSTAQIPRGRVLTFVDGSVCSIV